MTTRCTTEERHGSSGRVPAGGILNLTVARSETTRWIQVRVASSVAFSRVSWMWLRGKDGLEVLVLVVASVASSFVSRTVRMVV